MSKLLVIGASGSLGSHVVQQAVAANHEVSVIVRTPAKLPAGIRDKVSVSQADLHLISAPDLAALLQGHDAVINTAGLVTEGQTFVDLVNRVVTALELLPPEGRPVCWFMAGAGLLEIDDSGRRGVDLPRVGATYWPHRVNFERIRGTTLDWRILCPGPMVDQPALGLTAMRTSVECLPVPVPALARALPGALFLPVLAWLIPQMIVPYADAATLMLANLAPDGPMSRHRVGLALPVGLRGKKKQWAAQAKKAD